MAENKKDISSKMVWQKTMMAEPGISCIINMIKNNTGVSTDFTAGKKKGRKTSEEKPKSSGGKKGKKSQLQSYVTTNGVKVLGRMTPEGFLVEKVME